MHSLRPSAVSTPGLWLTEYTRTLSFPIVGRVRSTSCHNKIATHFQSSQECAAANLQVAMQSLALRRGGGGGGGDRPFVMPLEGREPN